MKRKTEKRNCDAYVLQRAAALAQMRSDENHQRNPVTPDGAVKALEMIVKIFEPQLSFLRIN